VKREAGGTPLGGHYIKRETYFLLTSQFLTNKEGNGLRLEGKISEEVTTPYPSHPSLGKKGLTRSSFRTPLQRGDGREEKWCRGR